MNEKIIRNCLAFLERVQLQWNEKEAATEVQNYLKDVLEQGYINENNSPNDKRAHQVVDKPVEKVQ